MWAYFVFLKFYHYFFSPVLQSIPSDASCSFDDLEGISSSTYCNITPVRIVQSKAQNNQKISVYYLLLSKLLLKKDIFGLCSYCSRRERISMLRVGTMLSRVLLKDDITVVWIHYRTPITTFGNSLTLLMKTNEILLSDRMFTPSQF